MRPRDVGRTAALGVVLAGGMVCAEEGAVGNEAERVAADLANPLAPITTVVGQFRAEFGNGPDEDTNHQLRLQPSFFMPNADQSAFLLRTVLPYSMRTWPVDADGLGDIALVPYYVPDMTAKTFVGYGASLGLPTATDDALGSGKWTAGPAVIVAKTGNPVTWGGLVQHVGSYAGDADRGDVNVTTVQPFLTRLLGGGWSATLTSESSCNWDADADAWTVPVALGVSKVMAVGGQYLSLALAGAWYAEKPDHVQDWDLRAGVTYVIR